MRAIEAPFVYLNCTQMSLMVQCNINQSATVITCGYESHHDCMKLAG